MLFPVQAVVWHETAGGASPAHDVCICAPTGSGKTLSYALPVLAALAGRAAPALRALCVLPTRDLASQVFAVLAGLCPALGLTAALAAGRASLAAEADLLAGGNVGEWKEEQVEWGGGLACKCGAVCCRRAVLPCHACTARCPTATHPPTPSADILVATPGRLIAHLEGTPGFSLASLRFLVVDETDRLLRQAYQGWLPKIMAALERSGAAAAGLAAGSPLQQHGDEQQQQQQQAGCHGQQARRVVKFVVSATLTRDPSKIARLGLHCPRYIAMSAGSWVGGCREAGEAG